MSTFYKLSIKEIVKETPEAITVSFEIPKDLENTFSFNAGQYITLKTQINGDEVRRSYSICSSPNSKQLTIAIKMVKNGLFSTHAVNDFKVGDTLEVSKPEGKFTLSVEQNKHYVAFAAGSGITPILSMIKLVLENEASSTFTLVYGNKTVQNTIFKNQLDELARQFPNNFNLHYVYSQERVEESKFGRIDKGLTNYFVKNIHKDILFNSAYLCGPEEMITLVSETLQENGFDKNQIHFELFTTSTQENKVDVGEGKTEVTILLDDEETSFIMDKSDSILAAALRNDIDAPYSCQGGVCSSCLGKITEGKAVMKKNSVLTDSELEEGFVLTCQAHPISSKVYVDFDDV